MWGKHFASMYEGSMRGAGSAFFAVWGYVISHMIPNREHGTTVEINLDLVAFKIGEKVDVVAAQVEKMCQPDLRSRTKDQEGRKLIKVSEYDYLVVNGDYYRKIRNEQERREYQRIKQAEYRAKKPRKKKEKPVGVTAKEEAFVKAAERGDEAACDRIAAPTAESNG